MSEQEKLSVLKALLMVSPTITCAALSAVDGGSNWKVAVEQIKLPSRTRSRNKVHNDLKDATEQDNTRRYQVVLFNHGTNKINYIKFVRAYSGLGLGEAKASTEIPEYSFNGYTAGIFSEPLAFDDAFQLLKKYKAQNTNCDFTFALYDADEIEHYRQPAMEQYDSFKVDKSSLFPMGNYGPREVLQKYVPINVRVEGQDVKVLMALGTWKNTQEANIFYWEESK